jgi:thiamine-phosphate pyrophosphorylase
MTAPRLFLVAPEAPAARVAACLKAACRAGDVASLVLPLSLAGDVTPVAQALNVAVLLADAVPGDVRRLGADGLHVAGDAGDIATIRASLGNGLVLGVHAGSSRHVAMEAAEAGADYLALDQNGPTRGGETILAWCASILEVPTVAFEPAGPDDLDILLPQNPDFMRPLDAMWEDEAAARRIIGDLDEGLKQG